jgi:hypothetical protein
MGGSFLSCAAVTVGLGYALPDEWVSFGLLTFGVLLEVAAFVRLGWELESTARKHGEPGLLERLGLHKHATRIAVGNATISISSSGSANLTVSRNPTTLEDRVRYLEEDVRALQRDLRDAREQHQKDVGLLRTTIRKQKEALEQDVRNVQAELKEAAIGGINSEYWWSVLLLFGLVLTNYNDPISEWFK